MPRPAPSKVTTLVLLGIGTLAASTAAPFIKLAGDMNPLTITAGRLLGAGLLYLVAGRDALAGWRKLSREDKRGLLIGAPFLALHFACWIGAMSFTDLPSAVLLLVIQPLVGSFLGAKLFRERVTPGIYVALVLALIGLAIITYEDIQLSTRHLFGDILAAAGSLMIIGFFAFGKRLRPRLTFTSYMTLTYGGAGLCAAVLVAVSGVKVLGYPTESYLWLLALILITTGVGHALINYTLPYTRLFTTNLVVFAEPVLAIAAAVLFIPGETVTVSEIIGGAFLMAGLFVGVRDERRTSAEPSSGEVAGESAAAP